MLRDVLRDLYTVFSFMRPHSAPPTDLSSGLGKEEDHTSGEPPQNACTGHGSDIILSNVTPGGATNLFSGLGLEHGLAILYAAEMKGNFEGRLPSRFRFR